eukprot:CAMPEP_0170581162 /NCGR_PEP_ID=MMETSP0224-20130122/6890_1 /TAXON_ID=285029 /ORGANISM="Togula jolla, Strain CCCM 725" /LENGTH=93 /DNA_ID=CAMNT_0010904275 /DNA_START=88 /DNA_END=369 /DNA_ORIENTATION=-
MAAAALHGLRQRHAPSESRVRWVDGAEAVLKLANSSSLSQTSSCFDCIAPSVEHEQPVVSPSAFREPSDREPSDRAMRGSCGVFSHAALKAVQ